MIVDNTRYINKDIEHEMKGSFLNYSMSVIVSRALPDVRDGLKPVHRRILYAMYENNLDASHAYQKSAQTVGEVLGKYHPHGDASVYDAMVRLAQKFSLRYPLIDGQGNFGSVDGDPAAAYRYTEARMKRITDEMLRDIEKETVDFGPNFDDSRQEPQVLPSRIPNLLVNGSTGIAVGMATNIPPHNLSEVCDGIAFLIDNPNADFNQLMEHIPGPDFPTGGVIMGRSGIRSAYATGRGKITLRGRHFLETDKNGRTYIIVDEIPYMVNKKRLIERIDELISDKRLDGIADLNDESDREGMRIVIKLKKEAHPEIVLNHLYSMTDLQVTVGAIMLALDGGVPKIMDLKTILEKYIAHQCDVLERRTRFDLKKALERQHLLEGLKIACDNIDEVIKIIRESYDDAKERLMERFSLSDVQATAILNMQLRRLQGLEIEKIENELAEIAERIAYYREFLSNHQMVLDQVKEDILAIKEKYGDDRRTKIENISGEVDIEDLIPNEECIFTFSNLGYVKRQPKDTYQAQRRGGRGIRGTSRHDEDYVKELFMARTHNYIMFATDKGRVYRVKGYEIPEESRYARGSYIGNIIQLQPDEKITNVIPTEEGFEGNVVMVTQKGIIKRTPVEEYKNVRKSGLIAITLDEGDNLAWTRITSGTDELIVATKNGQAIKFSEEDVRLVGRSARGVKAIELTDDDIVVGMGIAKEGTKLLTITEDGKGRRTDVNEYRLQTRGGKGVRNFDVEKAGYVAGVRIVNDDDDIILISMGGIIIIIVNDDDDIILISMGGIIIRMHVSDIAVQSRYANGVKVMRLDEDDKAVTFAVTMREDEEETESEEVETAEEAVVEETTEE